MKTLDEVIEAMETGDSFNMADALDYLYEYRSVGHLQEVWQQEAEKCKEAREKFSALYTEYQERISNIEPRNDPLTWDELKSMEGKPVWVECKFYSHQWAIIGEVTENRIRFYGPRLVDGEPQEEMGTTWQAFRKERHEDAG